MVIKLFSPEVSILDKMPLMYERLKIRTEMDLSSA